MGHQIIKQPDGKFCVFSTIVDEIVISDATEDELIEYYATEAARRERDIVSRIVSNVKNNEAEKSYYQFTMTYEQAVDFHVHTMGG
jgi:hypothetical protein